ncbi:MAG: response regulator [Candidatus Acidiferrales bacterium]
MSKASRLFRFRAHRETTLSDLLPAIPSLLQPEDAAPAAGQTADAVFLARNFESSDPSASLVTVEDQPSFVTEVWTLAQSLPHVMTHTAPDAIDMSDPLAILREALEPASQFQHRTRIAKSPVAWISHPRGSDSTAAETDDATLIGAKVHCDVSDSRTFLTETMDLEAIAASAREVNSESAESPLAVTLADHAIPCEAVQEEIVAEVSAAAEEFVAGQQHHINPLPIHIQPATHASPAVPHADATTPSAAEPSRDRRRKRRAMISAPIRVRSSSTDAGPHEVATTVDVSRTGILFHSRHAAYARGMEVAVVFPYSQAPGATHDEQMGRVVRVNDLGNGIHAVAIALGATAAENAACGADAASTADLLRDPASPPLPAKKPMVLAVDADESLRDALKLYLQNEGYDVIAVDNAADAREVLNIFTPALIIAEVEGENMPGYNLCAHVKSTPALRRVPVVLTTSSAYPSDYSSAHAFGAIVCMAKPFKQERLGHVVRLLAPLPALLQNTVAPHAADPTRVPGRDGNFGLRNLRIVRGNGAAKKNGSNGNGGKIRFKFPSFR